MKKQILKGLIAVGFAFAMLPALAAYNSYALPSFGFEQEFAGVTPNGDIRADLYASPLTNSPTNVRVGAFGGEVMIDPFGTSGIGYKRAFTRNMAAYGKLYVTTATGASQTNITLGFAYTGTTGNFLYNGNAEIYSCSNCVLGVGGATTSQSYFNAKGAGFFTIHQSQLSGKLSLGGELDLQLSPNPSTTSLFLGARWQPKPSVLIDLGVASSVPAGGGTTANTFATPAFFRLNIGL